MMCLQALAPPSCRICLPSVFQANFHSPFKAWSCFSSRSFREPPLRTKSPGDNASFLFACCSIESQFTVTSCLPLRSLMLHWNSLGQWFCLLSVGILSYAGLSYSQGGNRRCGVDSKQSFCIFLPLPVASILVPLQDCDFPQQFKKSQEVSHVHSRHSPPSCPVEGATVLLPSPGSPMSSAADDSSARGRRWNLSSRVPEQLCSLTVALVSFTCLVKLLGGSLRLVEDSLLLFYTLFVNQDHCCLDLPTIIEIVQRSGDAFPSWNAWNLTSVILPCHATLIFFFFLRFFPWGFLFCFSSTKAKIRSSCLSPNLFYK